MKGGGAEISIAVSDKNSLDQLFRNWNKLNIRFEQSIEELVFGFNFLAVDPDGHRIRVFCG